MSKKDRMLNYITSNTKWFMTSSNYDVIPYDKLSKETFNKARQFFAGEAYYEDVVCLISTSIMERGKTGILFTTDYMYSKSWGPFTKACKNWIYSSYAAEFDFINDFNEERMKELLLDLSTIALEEDEKEEKEQKAQNFVNKVNDTVDTIEAIANGGMRIVELFNDFSNYLSEQGQTQGNNQIETEDDYGIDEILEEVLKESFEELAEPMSKFVQSCEQVEKQNNRGNAKKKTAKALYECANEILIAIYNQALHNLDIEITEEDEYRKRMAWMVLWACILGSSEYTEALFQSEDMQNFKAAIQLVVITVDSVLEEQINNTLCETFESFSNTIINNFHQQFLEEENENYNGHELVSHNMDIVDSNNEALEELCDVLDEVTDALETINENI